MSDFQLQRARALAISDQEWAEARDWIRMVLKESPDLLTAFNKYLNTPIEEHGLELSSEQLAMLKRMARLGWGTLIDELGEGRT